MAMQKQESKGIILDVKIALFFLFIFLAVLIFLAFEIKSKGLACQTSPLTYGVKELNEQNEYPFTCSCSQGRQNSPTLFVNSENMTLVYPVQQASGMLPSEGLADFLSRTRNGSSTSPN